MGSMQRRAFLASTALAATSAVACAQSGRSGALELVETSAQFDRAAFAKMVDAPGALARQLWDSGTYDPLVLGAIKNALNGWQFGFGLAPEKIAMVACFHGAANAYLYNEYIWQRYHLGQALGFKDPSGTIVATNIFYPARTTIDIMADPNDPQGMYQDATIQALQRRGVVFLACHTAAADLARELVAGSAAPHGMTAPTVLKDLVGNLVPRASVVPSQVATIGYLQLRYHYAYTTT